MIIRRNYIVISIKKIVLNDFISEYLHRKKSVNSHYVIALPQLGKRQEPGVL